VAIIGIPASRIGQRPDTAGDDVELVAEGTCWLLFAASSF
jgi:hypothetical protein